MHTLLELTALSFLESDQAWLSATFSAHASTLQRELTQQVWSLSTALRPLTAQLVDAFAIPDFLVAAPIAFDWHNHWARHLSSGEQ
jgi:Acyl-CoA oxidase